MALHATQQTFNNLAGDKVVSIKANGGTVALAISHGDGDWVTIKTYDADTAETVTFTAGRGYRFTPSGGATYDL